MTSDVGPKQAIPFRQRPISPSQIGPGDCQMAGQTGPGPRSAARSDLLSHALVSCDLQDEVLRRSAMDHGIMVHASRVVSPLDGSVLPGHEELIGLSALIVNAAVHQCLRNKPSSCCQFRRAARPAIDLLYCVVASCPFGQQHHRGTCPRLPGCGTDGRTRTSTDIFDTRWIAIVAQNTP